MLFNSSTDKLNVPTATLIIYRQLVFPLTWLQSPSFAFSDKYRPSKPMNEKLWRVYSNFKTLILTYLLAFRALALRLPLWHRSNARNVSVSVLYGGQFTISIQLIKPNHSFALPRRRSTTVSLETYPLYTSNKVRRALKSLGDFDFEMNEITNYQI